jgi:hypothetical protein
MLRIEHTIPLELCSALLQSPRCHLLSDNCREFPETRYEARVDRCVLGPQSCFPTAALKSTHPELKMVIGKRSRPAVRRRHFHELRWLHDHASHFQDLSVLPGKIPHRRGKKSKRFNTILYVG